MKRLMLAFAAALSLSLPTFASAQMPMIPDLCAGSPDNVVAGQTRTLSGNQTVGCMDVSGTVTVADGAVVHADTIRVKLGGRMIGGSKSSPISATIIIRNFPIDLTADPEQWGHGFLCEGECKFYGIPKTPFVRLAAQPMRGQTTLTLASAVTGWNPGDRLILPDTRHLKAGEELAGYVPQWEDLAVASVSGLTVTLAAPLAFDHLGARNYQGALEYLPHVGNLSRAIVFQSESAAGTRGHVLFTGRADVDLEYVEFRDLGRTTTAPLDCTLRATGFKQTPANCVMGSGAVTHVGANQIGRYSLHFHHLMGPASQPAGTPQWTAIGVVADHTPKWAIAIHNSHFGLLKDAIVYDSGGAGIVTEDASETGNVIDHNFVVNVYGANDADREGYGREGVAFQLRGANNYVRNNVAANAYHPIRYQAAYGYKYFLEYLGPNEDGQVRIPNGPGSDTFIAGQYTVQDGNRTPILEFRDNEVYGSENGLTYWWLGCGYTCQYQTNTPMAQSIIKNLTAWHVWDIGIYNYPSSDIVIDGLKVRGANPLIGACCGYGYEGGDYVSDGTVIRNADIQGMMQGIRLSTYAGSTFRPLVVENSFISAYQAIMAADLHTSGQLNELPPRTSQINNVRFAPPPFGGPTPETITMAWDTEGGAHNKIQSDRLFVTAYNGVAGDNFQLFRPQQAPGFVVPTTSATILGSSVAGRTNAQNLTAAPVVLDRWNHTGPPVIAGAVSPCTTTRAGVVGFVCGGTGPPPPPPPPSTVDCVVSAWSVWSPINATTEQRTRTIVTQPANGGAVCPARVETRAIVINPPPPPPPPTSPMVLGSAVRGWTTGYSEQLGTAADAAACYAQAVANGAQAAEFQVSTKRCYSEFGQGTLTFMTGWPDWASAVIAVAPPVNPCVATPRVLTVTAWPTMATGAQSLTYSTTPATGSIVKVELTWPLALQVTDNRGCTAAKVK